jgi:uncharacterized protein YciI
MPLFAITYRYSHDVATRDALPTEHRDYLRGLADQGLLLISGPFGPADPAGALLLFRAHDRAHVAALVDKDPFTASGVIAEATTAEWTPVIGPCCQPSHLPELHRPEREPHRTADRAPHHRDLPPNAANGPASAGMPTTLGPTPRGLTR